MAPLKTQNYFDALRVKPVKGGLKHQSSSNAKPSSPSTVQPSTMSDVELKTLSNIKSATASNTSDSDTAPVQATLVSVGKQVISGEDVDNNVVSNSTNLIDPEAAEAEDLSNQEADSRGWKVVSRRKIQKSVTDSDTMEASSIQESVPTVTSSPPYSPLPPSLVGHIFAGTMLMSLDFESISLKNKETKKWQMYESEVGVAWVLLTDEVLSQMDHGSLPEFEYYHGVVSDYLFYGDVWRQKVNPAMQNTGKEYNKPYNNSFSDMRLCTADKFPAAVDKFIHQLIAKYPTVQLILHARRNEREYLAKLGIDSPKLNNLFTGYIDIQHVYSLRRYRTPRIEAIMDMAFHFSYQETQNLKLHNAQNDAHWTLAAYLQSMVPDSAKKYPGTKYNLVIPKPRNARRKANQKARRQ